LQKSHEEMMNFWWIGEKERKGAMEVERGGKKI